MFIKILLVAYHLYLFYLLFIQKDKSQPIYKNAQYWCRLFSIIPPCIFIIAIYLMNPELRHDAWYIISSMILSTYLLFGGIFIFLVPKHTGASLIVEEKQGSIVSNLFHYTENKTLEVCYFITAILCFLSL